MRTIVVAAVIERDGLVLITRRQPGTHLEGHWEFPGGKRDPDETLEQCLVREIREELAAGVVVGDEVFATTHEYEDRRIELHFLRCRLTDEPAPQMGQEMRWAAPGELGALQFPPADAALIRLLANERQ